MAGPPRAAASKLQWLGGPHEPLNEVRYRLRPMELPIDSMFAFCSHGAVVVAALLEAEVDEAIGTCGGDVRSRQASREATKI
jgi:hypothetical protein